ncbi:MAG: hypothetical protein SFU91_12355 [Chloroherpetonaceae bacterium]|nr:hypothetical protein [Chloroherpetonaceae bacterium]
MPTTINFTTDSNNRRSRELQRRSPKTSRLSFAPVNATTGALQSGGVNPYTASPAAFSANTYFGLGFLTDKIQVQPANRDIVSKDIGGKNISVATETDAVNLSVTLLQNPVELCRANPNTRFQFIAPMAEHNNSLPLIDVVAIGIGKLPYTPAYETSQEFHTYPITIMSEVNTQAINITYLQLAAALDLISRRTGTNRITARKYNGLTPVQGSDLVIVTSTDSDGADANAVALTIAEGEMAAFGTFLFEIKA